MTELFVNEANKLRYYVSVDGQPEVAEDFTATLRVGNEHGVWIGLSVPLTVEGDQEEYTFIVPNALIDTYRFAEITISYVLDDYGTVRDTLSYDIVKRYVRFPEINNILGEGNEIDWEEFKLVEQDIRYLINHYCGQAFYSWTGTALIRINDQSVELPEHMDRLTTVTNNTLLPADPLHPGWYLSAGGYSLNRDAYRTVDGDYHVTGVWGWTAVPAEVRKAAILLFKDRLCSDRVYREHYINKLRNENFAIEYSDDAFADTTGNLLVDHILASYKIFSIGVI